MQTKFGNKSTTAYSTYEKSCRVLYTYDVVIVSIDNDGIVTLDERYWDYSNTTGFYRNQFLGENKRETQR